MTADQTSDPRDALDVLARENEAVGGLLEEWRAAQRQLADGDDVEARWDQGSAAKLLVQHVAARESAKDLLAGQLDQVGASELAGRVRGDHARRKELLARLDDLGRGHQAITLANPEMDEAVEELARIFDAEAPTEDQRWLAEIRTALPAGEVPSAGRTYGESALRPNVEPAWYDRYPLLRRVRATYQHLRFSPRGGTKPGIDPDREGPTG